jgi:small GTP-binding protein
MHTKAKIDAATNAAQEAASAAQDSLSSAQESLNAAAYEAARAAMDAAEHLRNTVKEYFPTEISTKETHKHHLFHKEKPDKFHLFHKVMPEKSHLFTSFFVMPYLGIIIASIIVLLSALIYMKRRQIMKSQLFIKFREWMMTKKKENATVMICGPADAGKTLLFQTLSGGKFQQSSTEEHVSTFQVNDKVLMEAKKDKLQNVNFEFIDFPGQSYEFKMDKSMKHLNGLIILVDASSNDSINHGTRTLFSLMENKFGKNTPVLFCLNKMDLSASNTMNAIRQKILDELNKLKGIQSSLGGNIEKSEDITSSIGKSERLTWDNLDLTVSFGQISAKQGNVTDVLDFLESIQR